MRFHAIFLILLIVIGFAGCRKPPALPPVDPPSVGLPNGTQALSTTLEPQYLLDRMVTAYQTAISYSDKATIQILGKMSSPSAEPIPWNCAVAFQKPNKLRLEINGGIFVSDGEDCYAQIEMIPDQVLHFPSPAQWTFETLFRDVHLDAAMELGLPRSVLRFAPQLVLLFANNPLNTFCPKGAMVEWLEQRQIGSIRCDVIQISHSDGNRLLWISQENSILLRLDYQPVGLPVPEGYESIDVIRIEMTDARFDWDFAPAALQIREPQGAKQVAEFYSGTPGLPTAEEHRHRLKLMTESDTYRRIDQQIESAISSDQTLPKSAPRTFTLTPIRSHPLKGSDTMALLPGEPAKLLAPYKANSTAVLNLQGKELQTISPKELEDSIIMNIQSVQFQSGTRRTGVITLDGKFYLFDESFKPIAAYNTEPDEIAKGTIRDFQFVQHQEAELLLLGIRQKPIPDEAGTSVVRAIDLQGTQLWEHPLEGELNQISSAVVEDQLRILVSCTATQDRDSILILSSDGMVFEPVNFDFGRHILWFQVLDSTIYTLVLYTNGDVRFIGYDMTGKAKWSRLLPEGDYEVEPVYMHKEKKWLVPSPNGVIFVFDLIGNMIDTFSLDVVPAGLLCVDVDDETLLFVADGESVTAWKVR